MVCEVRELREEDADDLTLDVCSAGSLGKTGLDLNLRSSPDSESDDEDESLFPAGFSSLMISSEAKP